MDNAGRGAAPGERVEPASLLNMYALTLKEVGRLVEAAARYEEALALQPAMCILMVNAAATYAEVATGGAPELAPHRAHALRRALGLYRLAAAHKDAPGLRATLEHNMAYMASRLDAGDGAHRDAGEELARLQRRLREGGGVDAQAQAAVLPDGAWVSP